MAHQTGERPRAAEPEEHAEGDQRSRLTQNQTEDAIRGRAQRNPHAEFIHALVYRIRQHAEDAYHRERHRHGCKDDEKQHLEALFRDALADDLVQSVHVRDRLVFVDGPNLLLNGFQKKVWLAVGTNGEVAKPHGVTIGLRSGKIDLRTDVLHFAATAHIVNYAHDRKPRRLRRTPEPQPNGI